MRGHYGRVGDPDRALRSGSVSGMPERRPSGPADDRAGDSDYSWLYGGSTAGDDAERTQALRRPTPDAERTQRVPTGQADTTGRERGAAHLPPMRLPPPGRAGTTVAPPRSPTGATPVRTPSRRRGSGVRWGRVITLLATAWLLFLVAVPIYAWSRVNRVDAEPAGDRPADQPGTTYLLVGSDSRQGLDAEQRQELSTGGNARGSRTDTVLLLHVGAGEPLLLSIPRDSYVDIPGHDTDRINAAFNSDLYDDGGPELLVATVEANTGIRVDDYVEIGFGGFVDIVDSLGGVQICPKEAMRDPLAGLSLKKGCQEADGPTALGYARSRKTFALQDLTRVQNQREVIASIGSKAASPWTLINPLRYWNVNTSGAESLTLGENVGPISLARFAWTMAGIDSNGLSCTVPVITTTSSLTWDPQLAPRVFEAVADDRTDRISKAMCRPTGQ